jgi:Putative peptidoglycan binding domain
VRPELSAPHSVRRAGDLDFVARGGEIPGSALTSQGRAFHRLFLAAGETHVPDWLPKLIDATRNLFVPNVRYRIHWTWADSPLGTSCIAWHDLHPNNTMGYAISAITGIADAETIAAVRDYQADARLAVTGDINDALLQQLRTPQTMSYSRTSRRQRSSPCHPAPLSKSSGS